MSRVGIYAGTFDPVHNGHVVFALQAIEACGLGRVVFLPERKPRGKQNASPYEDRIAMLQIIVREHSNFAVQRTTFSQFTVEETLPFLLQTFKGEELHLLVGSDVAATMVQWSGIDDLFAAMHIIVGMRTGDPQPILPVKAHVVQTANDHVAASLIRSGESGDVAPLVRSYITDRHLYEV